MTWPDWPRDDAKGLARYVLPDIAQRVRLDIVRDDALALGECEAVACAIYQAFAKFDLHYARELYHPDDMVQRIRDPDVMLAGGGDATCLDLALLFAGACLGNELLPLVIVVDGHAFVAVSKVDNPRNSTSYSRIDRDGAWVTDGLLGPNIGLAKARDIYSHLVAEDGDYIPIECTGFARSTSLEDVPEGQGRLNGLLDFNAAVTAARAQLKARDFQFAIDPAVLQRVKKYSPIEPSTRNIPEDLRIRLATIFDQHRLFGGRNSELQALDSFIKNNACGYKFVTGESGSGKSALLANWIRMLEGRDDVKVAYHFINRQQRLASERDFFRTLCQQIKVLSGAGRDVPSSLEELQAFYLRSITGGLPHLRMVLVIDGIDEADGWAPGAREFPFPLPQGMYVVISARAMARDWLAELELTGKAEPLTLSGLNEEAIADLLRSAGPAVSPFANDPTFVAKLYERSTGDAFYLQFLVKDIEAGDITSQADLAKQPSGLIGYFKRWWDEVEASFEYESVRDLLGYLLVARGALTRADLTRLSKDDKLNSFTIGPAINRVGRYIVGSDKTGYDLCHPRFRQYISDEKVTLEDQAAYRDRFIDFCTGWKKSKNRYAIAYYGRHLIDAASIVDSEARGDLLIRLTQLLTDSEFQDQYIGRGCDLGALELDMKNALSLGVASGRNIIESGVLANALGLIAARKRWLQPERIFELASAGELDEAERRLALFDAEPWWRQAAVAAIAWSAIECNGASAREFLRRHAAEFDRGRSELPLLIDRLYAACADPPAPEPMLELPYWHPGVPDPVPEHVGHAIVARLGGSIPAQGVDVTGIAEGMRGIEQASYVAENDSPFLVALAAKQPSVGVTLLKEYISIHGANPYREYRNRSLWAILGAVLCHPKRDFVVDLLHSLVSTALKPGAADYQEALLLAIQSLAVRADRNHDERLSLDERLHQALDAAASLAPGRTQGDVWGHHCRRLAALAEAYAVALGDAPSATDCLDRAHNLHYGYAGFQTLASLRLAEANSICQPGDVRINSALSAALRSAHNIQESSFCATTTARVNALRRRWWLTDGWLGDLPAIIERFVQNPAAAEFAPIHIVGEQYAERVRGAHMFEISPEILGANTLNGISQNICRRPVAEMVRLNPGTDPDALLLPGTEVSLPDPAFAPILAARFAAAALSRHHELHGACARLIRELVPVATSNPTALDTVLARSLLAEPDLSNELLTQAGAIVPSDWMTKIPVSADIDP